MFHQCTEISDLRNLLRESGDKILDATTKLTLSNTLLAKINNSLREILNFNAEDSNAEFNVSQSNSEEHLDLVYLYDFIQKTLALKLLPDLDVSDNNLVDIHLFKNLRLLEVHRLSCNLIRGLQYVRSQLEYLTCIKQSVNSLGDILEYCGADKQRGHVWNQLLSATFSYNSIEDIDRSLEFTPSLKSLDLSHNCIKNAYLINCLPNLESLNLASNKLDMFPRFIGPICTQLKILNLRNNLLEDIYDLSALVRLEQLDLSFNCLLDHRQLLPLSNLSVLNSLCLEGNPLSYHKEHRKRSASYLHINTTSTKFMLDRTDLTNFEARQIGAFIFLEPTPPKNSPAHDSAVSMHSANNSARRLDIIVDVHRPDDDFETTDDQASSVQTVIENVIREHVQVMQLEEQAMQDSGFEPGPANNRMLISPSESIGSASSLNDLESKQSVIHCDSDIEILSNPSQSSIEVLSVNTSHNIRNIVPAVRSTRSTIGSKLKKRRTGEAHRSL